MNVIEPAQTEWVSTDVSDYKNDGTLWSCVDYLKHNAVTIRHLYALPRTDKCMDPLADAQGF